MYRYKPRVLKKSKGQRATIPIKNKKHISATMIFWIKKYESAKSEVKKYKAYRNYMMLLLGYNTAFRAEDLIQLKTIDVVNGYINIKEFKTKKYKTIRLNNDLFDEIKFYIERFNLTNHEYLFVKTKGYDYPLTRQQGDKILLATSKGINLKQPFSMHSLRKTFGYQKYMETKDIFLVQRLLNHSAPEITLRYICYDAVDAEKEHENTYYSGLSPRAINSKKTNKN